MICTTYSVCTIPRDNSRSYTTIQRNRYLHVKLAERLAFTGGVTVLLDLKHPIVWLQRLNARLPDLWPHRREATMRSRADADILTAVPVVLVVCAFSLLANIMTVQSQCLSANHRVMCAYMPFESKFKVNWMSAFNMSITRTLCPRTVRSGWQESTMIGCYCMFDACW